LNIFQGKIIYFASLLAHEKLTGHLGLQVCRGTAVMLVSPTDGTEEIQNPFLQQEQPPPAQE
jgi:hypothetical protein